MIRIHPATVEIIFGANLALAYERQVSDPPLVIALPSIRKRTRKRGFEGTCLECKSPFTSRQPAKFCPNGKCSNRWHARQNYARKKANPAAAKDRAGDYNRQWSEFRMADQMGMTEIPPPKLRGRPSRTQKEDIAEYRELEKRRLLQNAQRRIT